jgi:tetratricopeptide (TPR) repeat protein
MAVALAGIAAAGAAVWSYGHYDRAQRTAACEAQGDEIEQAWNPARKQALHDAIVGTEVSSAATTASKVMPWLDQQAGAWRDARVEACLDAEVHERWSADTLDRSLWCLDERRMELEALVDELTRADARVLVKAVAAASELASVAPCRDASALAMVGPPPRAEREAVQAVRADLARSAALDRAGRYEPALAVARDALERAELLEWRPLVAAARLRVGALLVRTGALADAETALEEAYFEASDGVAPEVVFDAAVALAHEVGFVAARHREGLRWARHAEVALASIHDGEGLRRAALLGNLATVAYASGDLAEATRLLDETLSIRLEALPPDHPTVATTLANLGNASWIAEDYARAKTLHERALAIREDILGPEHPDVAVSVGNLAAVYQSTGEYARASELFERALEISENALGPDHPSVATAMNNVAIAHQTADDYEGARVLFERALASTERAYGPRHPEVAMALNNLGLVYEHLREVDAAKAAYERALAIWEATLGPEHPDTAYALVGLADVALTQGRAEDAVPLAERAVAILEAGGNAAEDLADARHALAKALWEARPHHGRDRPRAVKLAEQARDAFREAGPGRAGHLDAAQEWLDARREPDRAP